MLECQVVQTAGEVCFQNIQSRGPLLTGAVMTNEPTCDMG